MILKDLIIDIDADEVKADIEINITGISYDTRVIRNGELFVAIEGYETDGHNYIEEAVRKGAACVLCEKAPGIRIPYIITGDSRKALSVVSATWFGHPAAKLKLIGVTGTNGKTSVTNLIKYIIEKCSGNKVGLIGTNGNFIGERELSTAHTTPESYEMQKLLDKMVFEGCKYVIMEVSSHALYLSRVHGIEYDIGVYTNLSPDHLDFHGSMEEYAKAKSILFHNCRKSVINTDDKYGALMISSAAGLVTTYAINDSEADFTGENITLQGDGIEFCVVFDNGRTKLELPIPGMFSVYNTLASIATTVQSGFDINHIAPLLQSYAGVKGRAEVVPTGHDYTVLIDYAHTPDALKNIIDAVRGFAKGRVITVFGCGGDRDKAKRPLMGRVAAELSDYTVITSDNPRTEEPDAIINDILAGLADAVKTYKVIENRQEAICWALDSLNTGDVLIVAGKGHETYQIIGKEKIHFDDREVVAEHIKQMRINSRKQETESLNRS